MSEKAFSEDELSSVADFSIVLDSELSTSACSTWPYESKIDSSEAASSASAIAQWARRMILMLLFSEDCS